MVHRRKHRGGLKKKAKILRSQLQEVENAIAIKEAARKKPRILAIESGHFVDPRALRQDSHEQREQPNVVTPELVDLTADDNESIELSDNSSPDNASLHSAETCNIGSPDVELIDLTDDLADSQSFDFHDNLATDEERHSLYYEEPAEFQEPQISHQIKITKWFTRIDTYARTVFLGAHNS